MSLIAGAALIHAQEPAFRAGVDVVTMNVTVTDRSGHFVSGLTKDDFAVFEDGQRRAIVYFENESTPVSLDILLDASGSMAEERFAKLNLARDAISRLVTHDLDAGTEWMFARFNSAVVVAREWTTDREDIIQPLRETRATGDTSIYDAIVLSIPLVGEGHFQKKAILVVSDGEETTSLVAKDEVQRTIGQHDVRLYDIRIRPGMRAAEVAEATARVAEELRHQYMLGYSTTAGKDGRPHAIRVEARRRAVTVRSRQRIIIPSDDRR